MRSFVLLAAGLIFLPALGGCATASRAEPPAPPYVLPDSSSTLRVRVLHTKSPVRLEGTGPYRMQLKKGGRTYSGKGAMRVHAYRSSMVFGHQNFKGDVVVSPIDASDYVKLNGRRYRGILLFHPSGGGRYDVVEYVDLDEYLYGVLPREVHPDWPLESLKAQAIVSRTYALSNKLADARERFDVSSGVMDQVYGGLEVEAPASNRAVEESRGEILVDQESKPVQTFFHSSCGGTTELPGHVWKSANAPDTFGVVADPFCEADPHYNWRLTLSYTTIRARLRRVGIRISAIKKITIARKSGSGRAEYFGLQTSRGTVEVGGNRFRLALGPEALRSTLITEMKAGRSSISFVGRGWGHGVGLCQWGARGRALAEQSYQQILEAYYPKARLTKI